MHTVEPRQCHWLVWYRHQAETRGVWVSPSRRERWPPEPPYFPGVRGGRPGHGELGGERQRRSSFRAGPSGLDQGGHVGVHSNPSHDGSICNLQVVASKHDLEAARSGRRGLHVALCDLGAATAFPCFKGTFYPAPSRTCCKSCSLDLAKETQDVARNEPLGSLGHQISAPNITEKVLGRKMHQVPNTEFEAPARCAELRLRLWWPNAARGRECPPSTNKSVLRTEYLL